MSELQPDTDAAVGDSTATPDVTRFDQALATLKATGDSGASWFFWIAALSLINTVIAHAGADRHFIIGLAITTIADVIARIIGQQHPEVAQVAVGVSIGFSLIVSAFAFAFGMLAIRRYNWIFGIGIAFYLLDGVLHLVLLEDIWSAAFHGYVLYMMIRGLNAYRKMNLLEAALANIPSDPSLIESAENE